MGTAPHVVEPTLPGARELYLDLGRFYDAHRLEKRRPELATLTARYKAHYARAYACLAAAGELETQGPSLSGRDKEKGMEACLSLVPAGAPRQGGKLLCFLDAFCCEGRVFLSEQLEDWRKVHLAGGEKAVSELLTGLSGTLGSVGQACVNCHDPLRPELTRHLLLPEHRIAFLSAGSDEHFLTLPAAERDPGLEAERSHLLSLAEASLREARRAHDKLEEVYNPCVDFEGVYTEAEKHIHAKL